MKLKSIFLYLTFAALNLIKAQDTVFLNGTNRVDFKVNRSVQLFFKGCDTQYNTATTTVRTLKGLGKILFKPDGSGYIIPLSTFKNGSIEYYYKDCGLKPRNLIFWTKTVQIPTPIPTPPTNTTFSNTSGPSLITPSYNWGRTIGNSSGVQFGKDLIRALRTPTGIVELNGFVYLTTGLVEGYSGIIKIPIAKPTTMSEVHKPEHGDWMLNTTHIATIDGTIYVAGFDSYGDVSSAVVAYKNDIQSTFQYGQSFKCKYQETPYKSGIHVNKEAITGLEVDQNTIYIYCKSKCYHYNRLTGQLTSVVTVVEPTYISKSVNGSNELIMTSTDVRYNGKVICQNMTSHKITNYHYNTKDFNDYTQKGSVYLGSSIWVVDNGNARVLQYSLSGVFIGQISYLPMNYNCAVDRGDPTRVFAGTLEFKVSYPSMTWQPVANWNVYLGQDYLPIGYGSVQAHDLMRDVITINGETRCFINRSEFEKNDGGGWDEVKYPTLFKLTDNGVVKVKEYDAFENLHITFDGKIAKYELEGGKALFYLDDVLKESVTASSTSALTSKLAKVGYTQDGSFVVYNPEVSHTGFHLTWVKGGVVKNAMPTKKITDKIYPYGDFFAVDNLVTYGGGQRVYTVGNRVFVNYLGEFFGGAGGQTNFWFEYENGIFKKRVGKTTWEIVSIDGKDAGREEAGNTYGGGVVVVNGKTYIILNCEHTGALQWFEY